MPGPGRSPCPAGSRWSTGAEFSWCDFEWDGPLFPDPRGMLARLMKRGLKIRVWINPYIAQWSALFAERKAKG